MKFIKQFCCGLLIWFTVESNITIIDGLLDENIQQADYAVILGNKVNVDGTLSERLEARLQKGLELYQQGIISKIIVSGGLGKEGYWEAKVMANYFYQHNIPQNKIIVDNYGNTTFLTAQNSQKIIKNPQAKIIVVSQYHHIRRCKLIFEKMGFINTYGVHAEYWEGRDFYSVFREFFAVYKYKFWY